MRSTITRSGSRGWLTLLSANANAASKITPVTSEPMVRAAVQLAVSACENPNTMRNSPDEASATPAQSIRGRLSGRLLRM